MAEKNGLWKNLRNKAAQNRRTGATSKAPTKEMLKQERKIKNAQTGTDNELLEMFDSFAMFNKQDFSSGQEVYDEYMKLNPMQQKQFLSTVKGQYNAQSSNNQEEIDENEDNVQDMALMKYGGYYKAQEGKDEPKKINQKVRRKILRQLYDKYDREDNIYKAPPTNPLEKERDDSKREIRASLSELKYRRDHPNEAPTYEKYLKPIGKNKPLPYQPVEKSNYNKSLFTDLDMRQSRAINVPFMPGELSLPEIKPLSPKLMTTKKLSTSLPTKYNKSSSSNYTPDAVDDYYAREYDKLPDNIKTLESKGLKDIDTKFETIPNLDKYIKKDKANSDKKNDNGFISSKPVTIGYDNPDEARAIQYRKLKNSGVLAPFRGGMTVQAPELYQESATPYLDNIREQRNAMLQQVNPNTATGQAVLANMYGQGLNQSNKAIGDVSRANAQNTTNWLNQRADVSNKQQQFDYQNDNRYYNDVAQLQANQDEEDINYMNSIANISAKRLQAKNSLLNTAIMTGLPDEALHIGDNAVSFDVSKIPHNFTSPKTETASPTTKTIMIKGIPHQVYTDENGVVQAKPIEIKKTQYGGMGKYNFRKQKSQ